MFLLLFYNNGDRKFIGHTNVIIIEITKNDVKLQEAQFEKLTRKLEAERESVGQKEVCESAFQHLYL